MPSLNSFNCERELTVRGGTYTYYDLKIAEQNGLDGIGRLPRSLKAVSYTHLTLPTTPYV